MGNACNFSSSSSSKSKKRVSDVAAASAAADLSSDVSKNDATKKKKKKNDYVEFLSADWPGSILDWSESDLDDFASCFTPHRVDAGKEISTSDRKSFFIVASGSVEVQAILPTIRKKTGNIREFLCKKDRGDMVYGPSVRKLVSESNKKELFERENSVRGGVHSGHKNVLDLIDTISVKSIEDSVILQLDWDKFDDNFLGERMKKGVVDDPWGDDAEGGAEEESRIDVHMLRTIMETNLTDYLVNLPILGGMPHSKLETLARMCRYRVVQMDAAICREGDVGSEVFMVLSGEVKVEAKATEKMVEMLEKEERESAEACDAAALDAAAGSDQQNNGDREGPVRFDVDVGSGGTERKSLRDGLSCGSDRDVSLRKGSVDFQCDYKPGEGSCDRLSELGRPAPSRSNGQRTMARRRRTLFQARHDCQREEARRRAAAAAASSSASSSEEASSGDPERRPDATSAPPERRSVELARLGAGDYFGEMATFVELPRAATVTATTSVLMASLSKTDFKTLYHAISPELEGGIERSVKDHMLQNLFQLKSPFLERIGVDDANRMAERTSIVKFEEGRVIFKEGEEADKFYFVYSGSLNVEKLKNGELKRVGRLYPGDYFGEMAIMNKSKRLATITAASFAVLLEITVDDFHECFRSTPELVREFIVRMKGNGVDLDSLLEYGPSRETFVSFLERDGFSTSGPEFCDEVALFERTFDENGEDSEEDSGGKREAAERILETYLTPSNPRCVDFAETVADAVKDRIDADDVGKDLFDGAKTSVRRLLNEDALPRFKDSDEFRSLLERMRAYDDVDVQLLA